MRIDIRELNEVVKGKRWQASVTVELTDDSATISVENPIDTEGDEETLRWFLEEYASRQPFSTGRAEEARKVLRRYTELLSESIFSCIPCFPNANLLIFVEAASESSSFQSLHWEVLEDTSRWSVENQPFRITVMRQVKGPNIELPPFRIPRSAKEMKILVVCARPKLKDDIDYSTITKPLSDIIKQGGLPVELNIVRPGTWGALKNHLAYNAGVYDIIHFDVHGLVSQRNGRQESVTFL
jgi:hypothetical protein